MSIQGIAGSPTIFELPIQILSPYLPDPNLDIYPLHLHDILASYSTLDDLSESYAIANVTYTAKELTPKERLAKNELVTVDMLLNYEQIKCTGRRIKHAANFLERPFNMIMDNSAPKSFELNRDQQNLATLTLKRPLCCAGESVIVRLDFSSADLTTFQLCASLEEYEEVLSDFSKTGQLAETDFSILSNMEQIVWQRSKTSFALGIPIDRVSTIYSNIFTHKFRIRLILWVADGRSAPETQAIPSWLGCTPDSPLVEKFELFIPVTVLPLPVAGRNNFVKFEF